MSDSNIGGEASILEERRKKLDELRAEIKLILMISINQMMQLIFMRNMAISLKQSLKKKKLKD